MIKGRDNTYARMLAIVGFFGGSVMHDNRSENTDVEYKRWKRDHRYHSTRDHERATSTVNTRRSKRYRTCDAAVNDYLMMKGRTCGGAVTKYSIIVDMV